MAFGVAARRDRGGGRRDGARARRLTGDTYGAVTSSSSWRRTRRSSRCGGTYSAQRARDAAGQRERQRGDRGEGGEAGGVLEGVGADLLRAGERDRQGDDEAPPTSARPAT